MLTLSPGTKLFLATSPVDGRKGIDGLSALVRSHFGQDPLNGSMYVFFNKRADRVRLLRFDRDGYVLTMKRLELGCYKPPWQAADRDHVEIEAAELLLVLEGIELRGARRRPRWQPHPPPSPPN